jgi:ABC-type branched-subunit amino acid transport system substrate-binding protein
MRKGNPELYLLFVETPEFEISRKKMLEMGIKAPVTSSELPDYTAERELFEGAWYVSLPDGDKGFNKRMQEFSGNDNTYGASYIYDIATLLVDAYEKAATKEQAAEVIRNTKSFSGKVGNVKQTDNFFVVPAELKEIENGETKKLY